VARAVSGRRQTISLEVPSGPAYEGAAATDLLLETAGPSAAALVTRFGAQVFEDFQYSLEQDREFFNPTAVTAEIPEAPSLEDVLDRIKGTSGCCPQVAGLAALLLSKSPGLGRSDLFEAIRSTSVSLGHSVNSQGRGLIDCEAALRQV
jgi:subtilisin family serine protease